MWTTSARFRDAVAGSHRAIVRVRLLGTREFGADPGGLDLPLLAGDVKLNATADIKGTIDLTVPGDYWDQVQPYGVELFAERGIDFGDGTREYVPLGYFRIDEVNQDQAPYGPIRISGSDRTAQLMQNRVVYPYQVPPGSTHRFLVNRLVNGAADASGGYGIFLRDPIVPIVWDDAGYNPDAAVVSSNLTVDDSTYDFLAKLVDAKGAVLRFLPTGELAVQRRDGQQAAVNQIAAAAQEIATHLAGGGTVFEDLSFVGMSANCAAWNDTLAATFAATHPGLPFSGWAALLPAFLAGVVAGSVPVSPVAYTIRDGRTGTLVRASRKVSRGGVYNMVRATGSDPAALTGYRLAYIGDQTNPLYWAGDFGPAIRYYASPLLRTYDEADLAAESILARSTGLPTELSLFTVPNPALQPLDVVAAAVGRGSGAIVSQHIIDEVTVPLVGDAAVEIKTRTVNLVDQVTPDPTPPPVPTPTPDPDPGTGGGGGTPTPGGGDPSDGTQIALVKGWGSVIDGDEFAYTGTPNGAKWGLYDGAGHDGNGARSAGAWNVHDGMLTCHGDEGGTTGGTAFKRGEMGYRVECRVRVYATGGGNDRYHPVLILWPDNDDWPAGAEYDFFETDEGTGVYTGFLHLPNHDPYRQDQIPERQLDIENWHNYAVEWNPSAQTLRCYLDGELTYDGQGRVAQAPGPMHLTVQLDNFGGGNHRPCNMDIAWVRIYQRPNA